MVVLTSIDIDECKENTHGCEGRCENTVGSFNCFCDDEPFGSGYEPDGFLCVGKTHVLPSISPGSSYLLFLYF